MDFGACGRGPRALDLVGALQNIAWPIYGNHDQRARYAAMRDALFDGYAGRPPVPADMEHPFEVCAVVRVFVTVSWMAWDWPHPLHYPWRPDLLQGAEQVFRDYLDSQAKAG